MIKKSTIFGLSLALALSGLWSCEKGVEETVTDAHSKTVTLTLRSTLSEQTRTTIHLDEASGKYKPVWDENEHIGVFAGAGQNLDFENGGAGPTTEFIGEAELSAGNYKVYTYYPYDNITHNDNKPEDTRILLPTEQHPSPGSFDAKADIMVGYPLDLALDADETTPLLEGLRFKRLMATLQIITSDIAAEIDGEPVLSMRLTAEGATLTGRVKIDLTAGEILPGGFYSVYKYDHVTAVYDEADNFQLDGTSSALVVVNPTTVAAGKTITLEIETENYKITKTAILASDMSFAAGEVTPLRMNLSAGTVIENTSVGKPLPFEEGFADCTSGNSTTTGGSGTQWRGNDNFTVVSTAYQAGGAVRLGSGSSNGTLTTEKLNLSQAFTVIVTGKGWSASENSMTVTAGSQSQDCTFSTFMTGEWETKYLYFESAGNAVQVSFVTSKRLFIDGIRIVEGKVTPPAELTVETNEITDVPAAGVTDATLKYTVNFDDDVEATCDEAVVTAATASNSTVTYTVSENTSTETRSGWIKLSSASTGLTVDIAVTQLGANTVPTYSVTYTVASTTSVTLVGDAPEGSSATFKNTYSTAGQVTKNNSATLTLSGYAGAKIKSVVLSMRSNGSAGTGSYEIKVGSDTIATQSNAEFNKWTYNSSYGTSYRDIDTHAKEAVVPVGEDIVITIAATINSLYIQSYTITYEYSTTIPPAEPKLTADEIAEVAAAGVTDATLKYTVKNFDDDVVATCDGTVVTRATAADGTVTYTVSENTSTETRTGSITLTSASIPGLSCTIKIVQKAKETQPDTEAWILVDKAEDVTEGEYVITFVHNELSGKYLYLPSSTATTKNPATGKNDITVSNSQIISPVTADMIWYFAGNNSNGFSISHNDYSLTSTNTAQGISIKQEASNAVWKVSDNSTYGLLLNGNDGGTRYLAVYNSNGTTTWRYYNLGNDYKGKLYLFKKNN